MTNNGDYVDNARRQRESPNVLRLRVLQIRSGHPDTIILIFEGVDDVGPYEVWLRMLASGLEYVPIPGSGKKQVLSFAKQCIDSEEFQNDILFFVDHDFDGLRGMRDHECIFCTAAYSVENDLCTDEVLHSILTDDFRMAGRKSVIDDTLSLFRSMCKMYIKHMREPNLRLFCASRHSLRDGNVENKIRKYVNIFFDNVELNTSANFRDLIPLKREPTIEEFSQAEEYFNESSDFMRASRGKFILGFLLVWLEQLHIAFTDGSLLPSDGDRITSRFRRNELSLRNLASRATPPEALAEFISRHIARHSSGSL